MTASKSKEMTFLDHLDELRKSLMRALAGLAVGVIACYFVSQYIQDFIIGFFRDQEGIQLALLAPTEGFVVRLKISLVAGIFLSFPWILYQLWLFVAPGLFAQEKKRVFPVIFFSSICFLTGASFAWFVLPWATTFFLSFSTPDIENMWSLGKYLDFVLRMFLAFGVVFELPILIYFLARFGIVTPVFLRKYRRHSYIFVLIAAAIITPPDIFTQVILAMPMVILYEGSIFLAVLAEKRWQQSLKSGLDSTSDFTGDAAPNTGEN
ncbi:MAG: twin-arginine translocase subunit TatC [Candidatus Electryonea clarkiae]|nr:twin-arginine translocase subunit TatC [Candidatus Electryonea clarkiae]MDP8286350.1 twin-arginine translocase subunit TatC [Candidatus Electryonea clarkiae]